MTPPRTDVCLTPLGEQCHCSRCVDCRVVASPPDPHGPRWVSIDFGRQRDAPISGDREALRAKLRACVERLNARGLDGDAIAQRAAENLRYWAEHPAPWGL